MSAPTETRPAPGGAPAAPAKSSVLRSGALMAAGSIVSRATGFVRSAVVVAALGTHFLGDGYAVANTIPNIVYILLIGGALNAVFVPELIKAAKRHEDGGVAYTDRLLTVCVLALLALTAAAVLATPWIVRAYAPAGYSAAQLDTTVALARFCLPQILFYGLFTLLGQVLNARGRFGAMMWTPILNNLVLIAVFGFHLYVSVGGDEVLSASETRLLGIGTTAGIVVQALALIPSLRGAASAGAPASTGAAAASPARCATRAGSSPWSSPTSSPTGSSPCSPPPPVNWPTTPGSRAAPATSPTATPTSCGWCRRASSPSRWSPP